MCHTQWPLSLAFIFKVIQLLLRYKTAKIWHILSCQHVKFWMDSFHILHKLSLGWQGVFHTMTCSWPLSSMSFSHDFAIKLTKWPLSSMSFSQDFAMKLTKYALYSTYFWMDCFHISHKWSLAFDLDPYLQCHSAMTLLWNWQNMHSTAHSSRWIVSMFRTNDHWPLTLTYTFRSFSHDFFD